eukprot:scaffold181383_cov18-Tisochrysis_lutea.AAC.3
MGKLQRLDILNASGQGMLADADAASISPAARVTSMAASLIECDMKQKAWNIGREVCCSTPATPCCLTLMLACVMVMR